MCLLINLMNLYYITVCIGVNNKLLVLVLVLSWHWLEIAILLPVMAKDDLTHWRICLQTPGLQLKCSVGRPVRGADGNTDWEGCTERHHVITSGVMERLISHISIRIICTLHIKQTAVERRHTKKIVSRDARLILMTVDASAKNSINVLIL